MSYREILDNNDLVAFKSLIKKTRSCVDQKGGDGIAFEEKLACETALFSNDNDYTFHTHPNGSINPSEKDRITTDRFKKQYMIIGLVPQNEVIVYTTKDHFIKPIGRFKL